MHGPARPAQHVHRRVPDLRRRTRRSASTIGGGTADTPIGRANADQAGARPYLRRRPSGSVLLFLGLHTSDLTLTQKQRPFLQSFFSRGDRGTRSRANPRQRRAKVNNRCSAPERMQRSGASGAARPQTRSRLYALPILAFAFLLSIRHCGNSRLSLWK